MKALITAGLNEGRNKDLIWNVCTLWYIP